ncbi:MAG: lamin tail domain-containing protein [Verrucomicrobiales bacterium]
MNRLWSRGGDTCDFGSMSHAYTNSLAFKTPDIAWGPTAAVPPANAWMHIAWVCQGNTISLYANGAKVFGPASFPVAPSGVLHIGNRHNNVEGFNGLIDDVALWNKALPDEAIAGLAAGTYSPLTAPSATFGSATDDIGSLILSDDFSGASLDAGKWETVDQGLENAGGTGYNAPSVAGGQLTLGGTATNQYWFGKSVRTVQAFDTSRVITAKVDRVSLAGTGTAWRSSLWLWGDSGHYFHFAHNTENAWSFNANDVGGTGTLTPTGGGTVVQTPADAGSHEMRLTYSPVGGGAGEIAMFLDGVRVGVHQVTNFPGEVKVMLTGQGRATNDTVSAVFDDFEVYDRRAYALPEQLGGEYPELLTELTGSGPHYFRKAFNFPGDLSRTTLFLNPIFDDGAIFYLNGVEIHRQNVPPAEVDSIFFPEQPVVIDGDQLSAGENVLAVELQEAPATTDALFGALLTSSEEPSPPGPAARGLVFSEIAAGGSVDFQIELANLGGDALDLTGYEVRSSAGGTYALGGSLASGGLLAITAADLGFTPADGDRLFLVGPGSALADGREVTGRLRGLTAAGQWLYPSAATFGAANAFAFHENVVINEIMYNPRLIRGVPDIPATYDRQTLLDWGASWRYLEDGAGLPAGWEDSSHPGWLSGPGPLGFEVNTLVVPIATTLQNPANVSIITYYFEAEFTLSAQQIAEMDELRLAHQIDDGAIFYLNGEEIQRYGMPGGAVTSATPAARGDEAIVFTDISIPKSQLVAGTNRLSVELHQTSATSSDFVMGARLESVRELTPFVPGVPAHQNDAQWIELFNKSATDPADLTGWEFADGIRFSFPANTTIAPGEFLVVARDAAKFSAAHPGVPVVGDFDGNLSRGGERLELRDANKNVADAVRFADGGRWDEWADGGGSSLELRDPDADNAAGEAWAASDESGETAWQSVSYTASGANNGNDPALYNEFVMGLLDSGEVLVDDISVIEDPNGAARELIQDGTFGDGNFSEWRIIGNHRHSAIVGDPENPGNNVLRLVATGTAEHLHNHAETTLKFGGAFVAINPALDYRISYRAKPIRGNAQLNTRLFFNRAARTTILDTPAAGGTPGAPNSQLAANAGPTYGGLTHRPAIPAAGRAYRCRAGGGPGQHRLADLALRGQWRRFHQRADGGPGRRFVRGHRAAAGQRLQSPILHRGAGRARGDRLLPRGGTGFPRDHPVARRRGGPRLRRLPADEPAHRDDRCGRRVHALAGRGDEQRPARLHRHPQRIRNLLRLRRAAEGQRARALPRRARRLEHRGPAGPSLPRRA